MIIICSLVISITIKPTLPLRTTHLKYYLANNGVRASQDDNNVRVVANPLNLIETFDKPNDIVDVVNKLCEWLLHRNS